MSLFTRDNLLFSTFGHCQRSAACPICFWHNLIHVSCTFGADLAPTYGAFEAVPVSGYSETPLAKVTMPNDSADMCNRHQCGNHEFSDVLWTGGVKQHQAGKKNMRNRLRIVPTVTVDTNLLLEGTILQDPTSTGYGSTMWMYPSNPFNVPHSLELQWQSILFRGHLISNI